MKKIIALIISIVLLISSISCKEKKVWTKNDPLTVEDFYLIRVKDNFIIKTDLHISELDKDLQDADKIDIKKDENYPEYKTRYYCFDGLVIKGLDGPEPFCDDNYFTITNTNYKTNRGIKIGDTRNKVLERYGNPNTEFQFEENSLLYADDSSLMGGLSLSFIFGNDDKIKEIKIEFQQVCL